MKFAEFIPYIAVIAAIIATTLAALYTFFGYLSKTLRERRRISREVLFNLLSVWKVLDLVGTKRESEIILEVMKSRFPEASFPDDRSATEYFQKLMAPALQELREIWSEGLKEKFSIAMTKLATVRPILAYEINSNVALTKLLDYITHHENRILSTLSATEQVVHATEIHAFMEFNREHTCSTARHDLHKDILKVARGCGTIAWIKTECKMQKLTKRDRDTELRKVINDFINAIPGDHLITLISNPADGNQN